MKKSKTRGQIVIPGHFPGNFSEHKISCSIFLWLVQLSIPWSTVSSFLTQAHCETETRARSSLFTALSCSHWDAQFHRNVFVPKCFPRKIKCTFLPQSLMLFFPFYIIFFLFFIFLSSSISILCNDKKLCTKTRCDQSWTWGNYFLVNTASCHNVL